ncbi:MAG: CoB--CoM heterodisulfide reductase iron-sulfur subunit A family protein [Candidatus Hydrothermarchaeales archaeon]
MTKKSAMVIGGGITGMQASLDLADMGYKVYLVEKNPSIGGNMAKLDKTFPTLDCAACIITPKLVDTGSHPNIELLTYSEVKKISGEAGNFKVKVLKKTRYVDVEKCTGCAACVQACVQKGKIPDEHNEGMGKRGAIYIPFPQAVPLKATVDPETCLYLTKGKCAQKCIKACGPEAIDYEIKDEEIELDIGSIILATGFKLDDPAKKPEYGYGIYPNVITSLQIERLLSPSGPTRGEVKRPSDDKHPKKVAFLQCVCSRDTNTNIYCSRFCCMQAIKEAILLKEHDPEVEVTIFYIDIRAFGKGYEELYNRAKDEFKIKFVEGRIAEIAQKEDKNLITRSEDIKEGGIVENEFDLVVLSVGAIPNPLPKEIGIEVPLWKDGFFEAKNQYHDAAATQIPGIFIAGCAEGPKDIPDSVTQASAAAMQAAITLEAAK